MKDKYTIKETCPHCGHDFKFQNTNKDIIKKPHTLSSIIPGPNRDIMGWDHYIPCPNCGYEIHWWFLPKEKD